MKLRELLSSGDHIYHWPPVADLVRAECKLVWDEKREEWILKLPSHWIGMTSF